MSNAHKSGRRVASRPPFEDLFWSRIQKTDNCWEWQGYRNELGYGRVSRNNKLFFTHRISWELCRGPIPDSLEVCHTCDNPACVNPEHLYLGTHHENMCDAAVKGRLSHPALKGTKQKNAKLTDALVLEIRELFAWGATQQGLADIYEVSQTTVGKIVRKKLWAHLPDQSGAWT